MDTNVKNQAQLLAELIHYGNDLISITREEFWKTYEEYNSGPQKTEVNYYQYKDFQCESMNYSIDGWDYFSYGYLINSGWDGFDVASFVCKKKVLTNAEMNAYVEMLKQ